jgi:xanthine dehydrogenase accessory factor
VSGWIRALAELSAAGQPAVLVTVLRAEGSTPREAGAKMVVTAQGFQGTIGGGHLELLALRQARELLDRPDPGPEGEAPEVRDLALGPSLGQCCGGRTTLVYERIAPPRWRVAVFGAGHVGKALVKLLADLPCQVTWIDPRPGEFPPALAAGVRQVVAEAPEEEVAGLAPGGDVVVMTHSHALDLQVVEAVLRRGDQRYLGLIGSATKRARFLERLRQRGFPEAALAGLTCPIGVAGIRGKLPAAIAVAVAAQLLQRRGAEGEAQAIGAGGAAAGEEP